MAVRYAKHPLPDGCELFFAATIVSMHLVLQPMRLCTKGITRGRAELLCMERPKAASVV